MGGVLIRFDREVFLNRHARDCTPEERTMLVRETFLSREWIMQDRGTLTPPQTAQIVCGRVPSKLQGAVEGLVCRWHEDILPVEGMAELVRDLKEKGYHIYLLSNAAVDVPDYWQKVPGSAYFDDLCVSAFEGVIKPQPEIYQRAVEKFGVNPSECVFIDDVTANIEAAYNAGMQGIVFHGDMQELRCKLDRILSQQNDQELLQQSDRRFPQPGEKKKLAVFFPGIGYTVDKPLLYYSRKIAVEQGYETKLLPYQGFPPKIQGDDKRMLESFQIALTQTEEMLSDTDLASYDEILFVGKSIGTIVAARIAADQGMGDRIRFVFYTPLEETFRFPAKNAIVFTGSNDPWVGRANSKIPQIAAEKGHPCHIINDANHSLETGNAGRDIENLRRIIEETRRFILSPKTSFVTNFTSQ